MKTLITMHNPYTKLVYEVQESTSDIERMLKDIDFGNRESLVFKNAIDKENNNKTLDILTIHPKNCASIEIVGVE